MARLRNPDLNQTAVILNHGTEILIQTAKTNLFNRFPKEGEEIAAFGVGEDKVEALCILPQCVDPLY